MADLGINTEMLLKKAKPEFKVTLGRIDDAKTIINDIINQRIAPKGQNYLNNNICTKLDDIKKSIDYIIKKIDSVVEYVEFIEGKINYKEEEFRDFEIRKEGTSANLERLSYKKIYNDGYTPQGITIVDGMCLISAYNKDNSNSRIYMYDKNSKYKGLITLDSTAHVGGITYDYRNNLLFVTESKGKVAAYDWSVLKLYLEQNNYSFDFTDKKTDFGTDDIIFDAEKIMPDDFKASTIYYYDGYLYVAHFNPTEKGLLKKFKIILNNGKLEYQDTNTDFKCPMQTQGIAITDYNNKKYLIVSQSLEIAEILVYEINEDTYKYVGSVQGIDPTTIEMVVGAISGMLPPLNEGISDINGIEGVKVNSDNIVYFVSEKNDKIFSITMGNLLNNISKKGGATLKDIYSYIAGMMYEKFK